MNEEGVCVGGRGPQNRHNKNAQNRHNKNERKKENEKEGGESEIRRVEMRN